MIRIQTRPLLMTFWRELMLLTSATVATGLLVSAHQTALAFVVLLLNGLAITTLAHLAKRSGLWRGTLRWLNLGRRLRVESRMISDLHLEGLADEAEGILVLMAKAPAALKTYLAPTVDDCTSVVARALTLANLANDHRRELRGLKRVDLVREIERRKQKLATTSDPWLQEQLVASVAAVESQLAVSSEHHSAVERIECELDSAEQTLRATRASLKHLGQRVKTPGEQSTGALGQRLALRERVEDLSQAIGEVSRTPLLLARDLHLHGPALQAQLTPELTPELTGELL